MTDITLDNIKITVDSNDTDYNQVCNNLYEYNVCATNGLLKKPGKDINLYLDALSFIPSLRLSGGWRPVILTVQVCALFF